MASTFPRNKHRSVFIGNIPYHAEEKQLIEICEEIGPVVSFRLVMDNKTGKRKGFGFCEYLDEETALSARRNLQGYMVRGRKLHVDLANEGKNANSNRDQGQDEPGVKPNLGTTEHPTGNTIPVNPAASQPNDVLSALAVVLTVEGALAEIQSELANQQGLDPLTIYLSKLSSFQLLEIISAVKFLATHHKPVVRQYLQQNPKFLRAQNQAEIMLGLTTPATMQMTSSSPQHHSQVSLTKMPQQPVATISVQPRPPTENSISVVQQNSIPPVQVLPHHQAAKTRPGNLLQEETAHSAQVNLQGYMGRSDPGVGQNLGTKLNPAGTATPVNPAASQPLGVPSASAAMSATAIPLGGMQRGLMTGLVELDKSNRSYQQVDIVDSSHMLPSNEMQSIQYYPTPLGQTEVQLPMEAVRAGSSDWVGTQNSVPLTQIHLAHPQNQVTLRPSAGSYNWVEPINSLPWAQVPLSRPQNQVALGPSAGSYNWVEVQNPMPLAQVPLSHPQNQVALSRPGRPLKDATQFSYCRQFGAETPVDLQSGVKSWPEYQPTKIRKLDQFK